MGHQFDAVPLRPLSGSALETVLTHAPDPERALAALFSLGTSADVAQVWVGGDVVHERSATDVRSAPYPHG